VSKPSKDLAERIIKRLVAEGLVRNADRESLAAKLAQGKMQAEDWRLALENTAPGVKP
jgi:hypothetical protein